MKHITGYTPFMVNNLYADNTKRIINNAGYQTLPIKKILTNPKIFFKCKIINFNWFENVNSFKQYILRSILLSIVGLSHIKIVYTIHNKQPHDLKNNKFALLLMKKLCVKANAIVGLCSDTKEIVEQICPSSLQKLFIIPHPNYIVNYGADNQNLREKYGFSDGDFVLLYFGFVSPYKNIEMLIQAVDDLHYKNMKLLIAGETSDEVYKNHLIKLARSNSNVVYDFRYISNDELVKYYNTSDIVTLPYRKESSLNSGAVYLAFSLKKTVVCPDIGTINYLENSDFVYKYSYRSDEEHYTNLVRAIDNAYKDFCQNKNLIINKGKMAYEYIKVNHSDQLIEEKYKELYKELTE